MTRDREQDAARYLRTLYAVEREAMTRDDVPMWLVEVLAAVDPEECRNLYVELEGGSCPTCGVPYARHSVRVHA